MNVLWKLASLLCIITFLISCEDDFDALSISPDGTEINKLIS